MKTSRVLLLLCLVVASTLILRAATMQAPIVKGTPDEVTLVANFSDFSPDAEYRIGVGSTNPLPGLQVALYSEDSPLTRTTDDFTQGYTSSWWSIDKVMAKGFIFAKGEMAGKGLTLRVRIPRKEADQAGSVYVFVARKYGEKHWYLEDGSEVSKVYW